MNSSPLGPKLVNFCQVSLTKHVECTSVCADDHPVENLLAGPTSHGPRGFRVEHFVRPPVHLDFHFLAPVDVACVVVKPALSGEESAVSLVVSAGTAHSAPGSEPVQVGRGSVRGEGAVLLLKNRVFERRCGCRVDLGSFSGVLGSRVTQTDTKRKLVEESLKDVRNVGSLRLTVSYFSGPRPVSLELVEVWGTLGAYVARDDRLKALAVIARLEKRGQAAVDTSRDGVMIYKASSRPPPGAGPSECTLCHPTPGKSCYRHSSAGGGQDSFTFTADSSSGRKGEGKQDTSSGSKVCLSLQRGLHVSCPASGQSVQSVWSQGELSKHGPDSAAQHGGCGELNITGHSSTGCGGAGQSPCNAAAGSGPSLESCGDSGTVGIPERFLDEITCEVMILPMLLPSGHVVDRSTLDKLHHTDSVYGRPPSDPFTGVAFSEHAEPQFSVELKQQIDSFMSRHKSRVKSTGPLLGQTLGSATDIALHLSSTKAPGVGQKRGRGDGSVFINRLSLPPPTKKLAVDSVDGEGESLKEKWTSSEETARLLSASSTRHSCSTDAPRHLETRKTAAGTSQSHELELASSLDRELQDLLHN